MKGSHPVDPSSKSFKEIMFRNYCSEERKSSLPADRLLFHISVNVSLIISPRSSNIAFIRSGRRPACRLS